MITANIEFGGVEYPCRMVKDNQGEYLIIGSTALLDALHPAVSRTRTRDLPVRKHRTSTMRVFFFTDERTLALPDKELVEELRRDNLEWF